MKAFIEKITPASGFSQVVHLGFNILMPLVVFVFVRINFVGLALTIILLSKWRMFAVRPRFWVANVRANAVDIIVGVSLLLFMVHTSSLLMQFAWMLLYIFWLVAIKPASSVAMVSVQAMIGFLCGLMALFVGWPAGPSYGLVLLSGLICYLAARHFFDSFDEPYARLLAYLWGYFGACLLWVLAHWLLFYGAIAQPVLLLVSIGYGLGALYYLDHQERLSKNIQRQFIVIMVAIVVVVLVFSHWNNQLG